VGQEAPADVTRAVAAGRRAAHAVRLAGLPDELRAVHVAVLLPLGRQGAARRAAVGGVLPRHVTLAVAAGHRTPGEREEAERRELRESPPGATVAPSAESSSGRKAGSEVV